jgi:hypothetical protein
LSEQPIITPFTLEHWRELAGAENPNAACLSIATGPAFTLVVDGQLLMAGGLRTAGIAQAWAVLSDEGRARPKAILENARPALQQLMSDKGVYRVYAEATIDKPAFFEHMGFHQQNNLWVR